MASGIQVNPQVVETFNQLKIKHDISYAIFSLSDDLTEIVVQEVSANGDYDEFISKLPTDKCRYAVLDFKYTLNDGGQRDKIVFFAWTPDTASIKDKMLFASSKDALKKQLNGIHTEIQATDLDEVEYEEVYNKVSSGGTK
ncbi:cofilin [Salpingoeca rosetta]|uniref:Cofilin n=1 Tax=Salpingoeca rosetta (strain ATCC 50818 / BSB-021) TaxID=946362 RepID=F2U0P4_SALR5|nr:cofilin [Salpingoeca rosetta]EGD80972.1 cofilin [Salpingoeca rosetta]|eukprot:XP_004997533.1 cofilin [Salpingoeca rosetta]